MDAKNLVILDIDKYNDIVKKAVLYDNICEEATTEDVTNIDNLQIGDTVWLKGMVKFKNPNDEIDIRIFNKDKDDYITIIIDDNYLIRKELT